MPRRITPGGPFLVPPYIDVDSLPLDGGEEGAWWMGTQAMPGLVAAAAAGIAIAAASSVFTVDEQIAYPPPLGAEASAPGTFAPRADQESTLFQWAFTEELPTPVQALEDSEWSPAPSLIAKALAALFSEGDDLPQTLVLEDDSWRAFQPTARTVAAVFSAEDELAQLVGEDYWWSYQAIAGKVIALAPSAEDELPGTPASPLEEESWTQPYLVRPSVALAFQADDDAVPAQPTVLDEVYEWTQPYTVKPTVAVLSSDNDEIFQQPAALNVDEIYAWAYTPELAKPKVTLWALEDERPAPPVALGVDEEYLWAYVPPPARPLATLWSVEDEFAPQLFVDEVYVWEYRAPIPRPMVTVWNTLPDEIFVVAVPVESDWQVWVPEYGAPTVTLFEDEQIALGGWVATPVYGWGARGKVGSGGARDPWQRIGSDTARNLGGDIGTDRAGQAGGGIGSDDA